MKSHHRFFLYRHRWISPLVRKGLGVLDVVSAVASVLLLAGLVYQFGFEVPADRLAGLWKLYNVVWTVFLLDVTGHLALDFQETCSRSRPLSRVLFLLLYLTLIPVIFHEPETGPLRYLWLLLHHGAFRLSLLFLLSVLNLSYGAVRLLGRSANPSKIIAGSFFLVIALGTGLLLLPNCTQEGISWVDALFVSTSAVCVTGLSPLDLPSTFTGMGMTVIILLIQTGGLGVMTLTCFFAMFFMGNSSLYNRMVVRDLVSSDSLSSLLSTLGSILLFTLGTEACGMLVLFADIHGTMGWSVQEELAFAAFHSVSAFCNAGFSTVPGGLGNPGLLEGHNLLYVTMSLLIISGGIGFPILINLKDTVACRLRLAFSRLRTGSCGEGRLRHPFSLNTRVVLRVTVLLLAGGTALIGLLEWNRAFAGAPVADKLVQAFFNAASPRTAGFSSYSLTGFSVQTLLVIMFLMFVGGAAQSTAGGVKVNAFAVSVMNLWSVLRGRRRVQMFGRRLAYESVRRSNATVVMYLAVLSAAVFILTFWEPEHSVMSLAFECISALSTVGLSLDLTPRLEEESKLLVVLLMFVGRVGVLTFFWGFVRPHASLKFKYPEENIIIN